MKMTDLKVGDVVVADGGFGCLEDGQRCEVKANAKGELYVECDHGNHYLEGQKDFHGELIGLTKAEEIRPAGPCCACGKPFPADSNVNLCFMDFRAPQPGTGWGCVVCGLPNDGAISVLCDACIARTDRVRMVCDGNPLGSGRLPRERAVVVPFAHDRKKHEEDGSWPG
jgi:hypothetical protein